MNARPLFQYSHYSYNTLKELLPILGYEFSEHIATFDQIDNIVISGDIPIIEKNGAALIVAGRDFSETRNKRKLITILDGEKVDLYENDFREAGILKISGMVHYGQKDIVFEVDKKYPPHYASQISQMKALIMSCHIPLWMMPGLPVLVSFDEKVPREDGEIIRGESHGPNVIVRDIDDPITVLLHEMGHMFYNTVLNEKERAHISNLYMSIDTDRSNGLFRTSYESSSDIEYFATIYTWYLKGIVLGRQYREVLLRLDPSACSLIEEIFSTRKNMIIENSVYESLKRDIIASIRNGGKISELAKVNGETKEIYKAVKINDKIRPIFDHRIIGDAGDRQWAVALNDDLRGSVFVLNKGYIDFEFMKRSDYYLVPRRTFVMNKAGRGYYQSKRRNPYYDIVPYILNEDKVSPIKEELLKSKFYTSMDNGEEDINLIIEYSKQNIKGALSEYERFINEAEYCLEKSESSFKNKLNDIIQRRRIDDARRILNKLKQENENVR